MRLLKFAGASGTGLALDYAIYTVLCELGLAAGVANLVSASAGVTFVFLVSAHRIFETSDHFLVRLFAVYAVYQVIAIVAASWLVGTMTGVFAGAYLLGKTVVLPLTFGSNYLFTSWLLGAEVAPERPQAVTEEAVGGDERDRQRAGEDLADAEHLDHERQQPEVQQQPAALHG